MTVHAIRIAGDPVLHNPTREITEFDDALRTLTEDMFETMYAAEGVGLAANQIGLDLRVFVYDCPDDEGTRHKGVVVNPKLETSEIPETMPDPDNDWEGCLSAPGESFPTGRATWAKVTGQDVEGNQIEVEGTGFFARCLQHETDHLDGYIYLDRLVGRHAREAKRMIKSNKWGVPGNSWLPPREPSADDED
ncbi:peptide deformylase [Amycolatopsis xylanica]|uniref:Peptide deformylase n=1 Tax=Amycolatopsis xylanica TaxID=589385 RepID=A0A1H2YQK6_9PSEU|nr:peptide deformylase [Amycolatopsis xylanica]SDX06809.1 peptide deformylase [Amycolatopsis xylanica]